MSVESKIYLGVFVELPIDFDAYDEKYDAYMNGCDKFTLIYDGMSGQYARFGIALAELEDVWDAEKKIINVNELPILVNMVENKTMEVFGLNLIPEFMLFSHCH